MKGALEGVEGAFDWIVKNKDGIKTALGIIAASFVGLKVATWGLNIAKIAEGLGNLLNLGGGGNGGAGGGGTGGTGTVTGGAGWLTGVSNKITQLTSTGGALLTQYDPTGLTALIPQWFGDNTVFGQTLRNGGSISDAITATKEAVSKPGV